MFVISIESELHHSIGSLIDGAHSGPKTGRDYLGHYRPNTFEMANGKKEKWCHRERGVVVGGCRSLVAEYWWLKPKALGSIPGSTTFLSFPLPFQRSSDSNGPDNHYQSLDLGEPHLSGSICCDEAQILSK